MLLLVKSLAMLTTSRMLDSVSLSWAPLAWSSNLSNSLWSFSLLLRSCSMMSGSFMASVSSDTVQSSTILMMVEVRQNVSLETCVMRRTSSSSFLRLLPDLVLFLICLMVDSFCLMSTMFRNFELVVSADMGGSLGHACGFGQARI